MADQAKDDNQVTKAKEDGLEVARERAFPCNYCDQVFHCSQSLEDHQNAHRMERSALERPQEPQYDPLEPYINIPSPPPFISHFVLVQNHHQPLMQLPYYCHDKARNPRPAYALQAFHLRQPLYSPSNYGNRYHPYNFSPNRTFCPSGPAYPRVNYNPRASFENLFYWSQVVAAKPPSLNSGLNLKGRLNCHCNCNIMEQGSSSGENQRKSGHGGEDKEQAKKDDKKEDENEELDLTLRL